MIDTMNLCEYPVVLHPNNENRDKAAKKGEIGRPEGDKQRPQTMRRGGTLMARNFYRRHKKRYCNGEHAIAKSFETCRFLLMLH